MPPPDTIYIPGVTGPPPPLPDSLVAEHYLHQVTDTSNWAIALQASEYKPQFLMPEWQMFLVVVGSLVLLYLLLVRLPELRKRREDAGKDEEAELLLASRRRQYNDWLTEFNPYYKSLPPELKEVFLHRTIRFVMEKEFRFHQLPSDDFIRVMIAGAAVQMTLGLKNYLMDYFPVIHVIRKEYVLEMDKETYYGHVSRSGIYIAWNHFLGGYADYTDSYNVGLHEMAHAVSFDVFLGQVDRHDLAFRSRLEDFSMEGMPVFRAMRSGSSHLLDDYGATNFDEFWAVCVETFFEKADEFSRTMPDLYLSIVDLLNQDPLNPAKIINKALAGHKT